MTSPTSFEDFLTIRKVDRDRYISKWPTEGNSMYLKNDTAHGGCTMAFAIVVAYATVKDTHRLYSCLGTFLAPALTKEKLQAKVLMIRDTRSFSTRFLEIQQQRGANLRTIAMVQLDFQVPEKQTLLTFSVTPKLQYSSPEASWDEVKVRQNAKSRHASDKLLRTFDTAMPAQRKYLEVRCPPEGFNAETLHGIAPDLDTLQKGLQIVEKTMGYYWKLRVPTESQAIHAAAIAFAFDAAMPLTPAAFAALPSPKETSLSSLDFALRFFSNDLNANQWLLKEEQTLAGGEGRTYVEARLWNSDGNLVATNSEQCLLRPDVGRKEKL